jgi:hypothetical protein
MMRVAVVLPLLALMPSAASAEARLVLIDLRDRD